MYRYAPHQGDLHACLTSSVLCVCLVLYTEISSHTLTPGMCAQCRTCTKRKKTTETPRMCCCKALTLVWPALIPMSIPSGACGWRGLCGKHLLRAPAHCTRARACVHDCLHIARSTHVQAYEMHLSRVCIFECMHEWVTRAGRWPHCTGTKETI